MKKIFLPLIIIVLYGCGIGGEINNSTITSSSIMSSSSTENTSSKDWAQPLFYVNDNTLSGIGTLTIILSNTNSSENNIKKVELYIESYLISVNYSPTYYLYAPGYGFGLGKYKI